MDALIGVSVTWSASRGTEKRLGKGEQIHSRVVQGGW